MTKAELIPINPKYVTSFKNVDWMNNSKHLKKYYVETSATTPQLIKLGIPYHIALFGYDNSYKKYYKPITGRIIRKRDKEAVDNYLTEVCIKATAKKVSNIALLQKFDDTKLAVPADDDVTRLFPDEDSFYCPFCDRRHETSFYLSTIFESKKCEWIANMVTHYRHDHTEWDEKWPNFYYNKNRNHYDEQKDSINDKIKSEIISKGKKFLMENGITAIHFEQLQGARYSIATATKAIRTLNPEMK